MVAMLFITASLAGGVSLEDENGALRDAASALQQQVELLEKSIDSSAQALISLNLQIDSLERQLTLKNEHVESLTRINIAERDYVIILEDRLVRRRMKPWQKVTLTIGVGIALGYMINDVTTGQ